MRRVGGEVEIPQRRGAVVAEQMHGPAADELGWVVGIVVRLADGAAAGGEHFELVVRPEVRGVRPEVVLGAVGRGRIRIWMADARVEEGDRVDGLGIDDVRGELCGIRAGHAVAIRRGKDGQEREQRQWFRFHRRDSMVSAARPCVRHQRHRLPTITVHARADEPSSSGARHGKQVRSQDVSLISAGASAAMLEPKGADDCATEQSKRRASIALRLRSSPYLQSTQSRQRELERIAGCDGSHSDPIGTPADHLGFDRPAGWIIGSGFDLLELSAMIPRGQARRLRQSAPLPGHVSPPTETPGNVARSAFQPFSRTLT